MTMSEFSNIKVSGQNDLVSARKTGANDNQNVAVKTPPQNESSRSDTVSLTDAAELLQSLQKIVADAPIVDQSKVDAIRAAIADGSYTIDATKVAQNLLNSERQFN
jgi:negative regulator of flagellin synthesis FlgM